MQQHCVQSPNTDAVQSSRPQAASSTPHLGLSPDPRAQCFQPSLSGKSADCTAPLCSQMRAAEKSKVLGLCKDGSFARERVTEEQSQPLGDADRVSSPYGFPSPEIRFPKSQKAARGDSGLEW